MHKTLGLIPALHDLAMEAHSCNPNTWELEAGRWGNSGHPWLHSEFETMLGGMASFLNRNKEREKKGSQKILNSKDHFEN